MSIDQGSPAGYSTVPDSPASPLMTQRKRFLTETDICELSPTVDHSDIELESFENVFDENGISIICPFSSKPPLYTKQTPPTLSMGQNAPFFPPQKKLSSFKVVNQPMRRPKPS